MNTDEAQEISERDQLWASLRTLRPEIDALAVGEIQADPRQKQVIQILARIVVAEMDFRERAMNGE